MKNGISIWHGAGIINGAAAAWHGVWRGQSAEAINAALYQHQRDK
jgi:hypothetical protein